MRTLCTVSTAIGLLAVGLAALALPARAATISSTETLNQQFTTVFGGNLNINNSDLGINSTQSFTRTLTSGSNSVTLRTDTDADTGVFEGVQFKPFGLNSATTPTQTVNVTRVIVDVPGNFPLPPVTHTEIHTYTQRMTFGNVTGTPQLSSSTTGNIVPSLPSPPNFFVSNNLTLSAHNFTVTGTYEFTSPTETFSTPFSVEYEAQSAIFPMVTRIVGGPGFGPGFDFSLRRSVILNYRTVNSVPVNRKVDDLLFTVNFPVTLNSVRLIMGEIPEPSSLTLVGMALGLGVMGRRRR